MIIVESKGSPPVDMYTWNIRSATAQNDVATNTLKEIATVPIYILAVPACFFKMTVDRAVAGYCISVPCRLPNMLSLVKGDCAANGG